MKTLNENVEARPDSWIWAVPPGQILDHIIDNNVSKTVLARELQIDRSELIRICAGSAAITDEIAAKLSISLGTSRQLWLNLEETYRHGEERMRGVLKHNLDVLEHMPYRELMDRGYIANRQAKGESNKISILFDCMMFIGCPSIYTWIAQTNHPNSMFRLGRPGAMNVAEVSAWLRICDLEVEIPKNSYNQRLFQEKISEIRSFTTAKPKDFYPRSVRILNDAGIGYICEPSIERANVAGASRLLGDHPVIYQSLHGQHIDVFWFTFFHECAHILLGHLEEDEIRVDLEYSEQATDVEELQADKWAEVILTPKENETQLRQLRSRAEVLEFSREIEIHPAIVAGRLQHEDVVGHDMLSNLRERYNFVHRGEI